MTRDTARPASTRTTGVRGSRDNETRPPPWVIRSSRRRPCSPRSRTTRVSLSEHLRSAQRRNSWRRRASFNSARSCRSRSARRSVRRGRAGRGVSDRGAPHPGWISPTVGDDGVVPVGATRFARLSDQPVARLVVRSFSAHADWERHRLPRYHADDDLRPSGVAGGATRSAARPRRVHAHICHIGGDGDRGDPKDTFARPGRMVAPRVGRAASPSAFTKGRLVADVDSASHTHENLPAGRVVTPSCAPAVPS
jgi:hypothetical protein